MKRGGTVCGAVSLTVIFCALCMAVFAALTFVTANRERLLSELDARRAAEFYRADSQATRVAASLRAGQRPLSTADAAAELFIIEDETDAVRYSQTDAGTLAEFSIPAGGEQRLEVSLLLRDGGMDVLKWKKVYAGEWETDDFIILAEIN